MEIEIKENAVIVPMSWFQGLLKLVENVKNSQGETEKNWQRIALEGYASSAKTILELSKRTTY